MRDKTYKLLEEARDNLTALLKKYKVEDRDSVEAIVIDVLPVQAILSQALLHEVTGK